GAVPFLLLFFCQAEDGIRAFHVTGVQTCALPIFAEEDVASLTRISGVGRKTAQRMILELKGKLTPGPEGDAEPQAAAAFDAPERSEERRVGKGGRRRWWAA